MSVFDNNITKEHPYQMIFHYVSDFIELNFHNIMKDCEWNVEPAEKTIWNEFCRKSAVFYYYKLSIPEVYITSDSNNYWRVKIVCEKENVIVFNEIIEKNWEDIKSFIN